MNPYQAFLKSSVYGDEWNYFVSDLPEMLLSDNNLQRLLTKYPFLADKGDDIVDDFKEEIIGELEYWGYYYFKDGYTEKMLYETIYKVATSILKEIISKYIPSESQTINSLSLFQPLNTDDIKNYQARYNPPQDEDDKEDFESNFSQENGLQQIRNAEADFTKFEFTKNRFLKSLRDWGDGTIVKPRVKIHRQPPVIKVVDYFDPAIYSIIKNKPELLKTLDWKLFEEMLADILRRLKYNVELTKPTKDGGIDIIAIRMDENFGNHKYLLQAKRYQDAVQVSPVRELLFLHDELKATKSCLATTATFTSGAWKLAETHKWKLELKDQTGIMNWIDKILSDKEK